MEKAACSIAKAFGKSIDERIIAWNYMELLDRDLSKVQLSVSHTRLEELHPADVADILEQLDPKQRANVFQHLDDAQAGDAISEMEDEFQADIIEGLDEKRASRLLRDMDPDDAADIVGDLPYEKAETLLRLMGVDNAAEIRKLLGYKEDTAGGLMTTQFVAMHTSDTVQETTEVLRGLDEDHPTVNYVYVLDEYDKLVGVLSLRTLVLAKDNTPLSDIMFDELITSLPEEPEDEVAADISKYDLMAMPVVDENGQMLGIVTVDDAMEVIEDNVEEGRTRWAWGQFAITLAVFIVLMIPYTFFVLRMFGHN